MLISLFKLIVQNVYKTSTNKHEYVDIQMQVNKFLFNIFKMLIYTEEPDKNIVPHQTP